MTATRGPGVAAVLLGWGLGSVVLLAAVEAWTVAHREPTISARVQAANHAARIVSIASTLVAGVLLDHFFGS